MKILTLKGSEAKGLVDPFYEENGRATRARDDDIFFVAVIEDRVIGSVRYCIENECHLLRGMFIKENYRKKGIGSKILKEFDLFLIKNKIAKIYCLPYGHLNDFYDQIGFKKISPESAPKYLYDRYKNYMKTQDHIVMKREIIN